MGDPILGNQLFFCTMKRNTSQRAAIEQVICADDRPLSVKEILERGRASVKSLNQSTVYRNLKQLIDDGRLSQVRIPSLGVLYEKSGKTHHHHFYCRSCRCAFEVPGCALDSRRISAKGFNVEEHEIFLFGKCPSCAN